MKVNTSPMQQADWSKIIADPFFKMVKGAGTIVLLSVMILSGFACSKSDDPGTTTKPVVEEQPKQYDVPFANVPATTDIAMYEVNLWAFSASTNLNGVKARLDELKALGVNVIWLMPIYPSGELKSVGSPYAVKNYTQVNPAFGTLEDLRSLVKEAHARDMAVILDWVANHTAWDNPWMKNSTWYTRDASGNVISPAGTNWSDVADLNYGTVAMRKEMIKSMKYWVLEANVDGFRCDYAGGVPTDFWKQAIDTLRNIPNREIIMFAEASQTDLYSAGFNLIFGWNFYSKLKDVYNNTATPGALVNVNTTDNTISPEGSEVLRWITNHDDCAWDNSPVEIFKGEGGALSAFVLAAYMGGVPLIYNGQEVGFPSKIPFFNNSSTKIDWTQNPAILSAYKALMSFRNGSAAVKTGSIESYSSGDVVAFKRVSGVEEVLVIVNVRDAVKDFALPEALANSSWTDALSGDPVALTNTLSLQPYSYLILKK
jgi:alpha-amylase